MLALGTPVAAAVTRQPDDLLAADPEPPRATVHQGDPGRRRAGSRYACTRGGRRRGAYLRGRGGRTKHAALANPCARGRGEQAARAPHRRSRRAAGRDRYDARRSHKSDCARTRHFASREGERRRPPRDLASAAEGAARRRAADPLGLVGARPRKARALAVELLSTLAKIEAETVRSAERLVATQRVIAGLPSNIPEHRVGPRERTRTPAEAAAVAVAVMSAIDRMGDGGDEDENDERGAVIDVQGETA